MDTILSETFKYTTLEVEIKRREVWVTISTDPYEVGLVTTNYRKLLKIFKPVVEFCEKQIRLEMQKESIRKKRISTVHLLRK